MTLTEPGQLSRVHALCWVKWPECNFMVHGKNTDSGVPHTPWVWPCHCLPPTGTSQCFLLGKRRRDKPIWKHGCDYKFRFYLKGLAQGLAHSRHPLNGCLDLGLGSPPTMCRSLDLPLPAPSSPWLLVLRCLDLAPLARATPLLPWVPAAVFWAPSLPQAACSRPTSHSGRRQGSSGFVTFPATCVDDFLPALEPGPEPLRISPAHTAASGITAPLHALWSSAQEPSASCRPLPASSPSVSLLSLHHSPLLSPSSLYLFPPPLPVLNLPMTPIVLLRDPLAPWISHNHATLSRASSGSLQWT